jgi:hypothetical protein
MEEKKESPPRKAGPGLACKMQALPLLVDAVWVLGVLGLTAYGPELGVDDFVADGVEDKIG